MAMSGSVTGAAVDRATASTLRDSANSVDTTASSGGTDRISSSVGPASVLDLSSVAKTASGPSSGTKDFATVAKDARAVIDAVYSKGTKPFSMYTTGVEAKGMFSGLDRRSLYAIKSNEGGRFTAEEQKHAGTEMVARLDAATGQDQMGGVTDNGTIRDMFKRTVGSLDSVSEEEKSSFDWASQRSRAQWSYEIITTGMGEVPEKMDSTNPVAKMIKAALDSLTALGDPSKQLKDMPLYKQAQRLFAGQQGGSSSAVDIKA